MKSHAFKVVLILLLVMLINLASGYNQAAGSTLKENILGQPHLQDLIISGNAYKNSLDNISNNSFEWSINSAISSTIYLPVVLKNAYFSNVPSPFSIEIADLDDIPQLPNMTQAQINMLEDQRINTINTEFPSLISAFKDSSATWTRIYISWSRIQPTNSTSYNWDNYDNWLSQLYDAGIRVIATVSDPPSWAYDNTLDPCSNRLSSPTQWGYFNNFLTALIQRYEKPPYDVHTWEIMNEPDAIDGYRCTEGVTNYGTHGADYATMIQGAYTTIKSLDPNSTVLMGGIADDWFYLPYDDPNGDGSPDGKFNRYFIDDIVEAGAANSFDAVNFHYFPDFSAEWERWTIGDQPTCGDYTMRDPDGIRFTVTGLDIHAKGYFFLSRLQTCYGVQKSLWITEVGHHGISPNTVDSSGNLVLPNRPDDTLDNQARYVFTVYARGLSLGADNITWYALKVDPTITPDDYQGLLYDSRDPTLENQPKPAFYAYKTITHELADYQFLTTAPSDPNIEAYTFINPFGMVKTIAWSNQTSGYSPYTINNVSNVRLVYRPYDDETDHQLTIADGSTGDVDGKVNGSITINLDIEPVIIQPNP
jgi:hypothetical protein